MRWGTIPRFDREVCGKFLSRDAVTMRIPSGLKPAEFTDSPDRIGTEQLSLTLTTITHSTAISPAPGQIRATIYMRSAESNGHCPRATRRALDVAGCNLCSSTATYNQLVLDK